MVLYSIAALLKGGTEEAVACCIYVPYLYRGVGKFCCSEPVTFRRATSTPSGLAGCAAHRVSVVGCVVTVVFIAHVLAGSGSVTEEKHIHLVSEALGTITLGEYDDDECAAGWLGDCPTGCKSCAENLFATCNCCVQFGDSTSKEQHRPLGHVIGSSIRPYYKPYEQE